MLDRASMWGGGESIVITEPWIALMLEGELLSTYSSSIEFSERGDGRELARNESS
jgi:hypothetical protein